MDEALLLARTQFGLNIAFHILFPTLTIALCWYLLYFRIRYHRSGEATWLHTYKLWTKVFALTFAMGVVSGIVMSFQFGTNWPGYMKTVGNIAGPLLAYEVLTAFFLEATFLGVMLFGMNRVPAWMHIGATVLVAAGTTLSAFWILALNSWMQTPAGHIRDGAVLIAGDWLEVIFNPSFPYRFAHMLIALRTATFVAAFLTPVQLFVGDLHGLNTLEHQPAKIAAMEAIWNTQKGAPLVLFAIPNEKEKRNDFAIEIPRGASLILRHDPNAELQGLDAFAPDIPPVAPVFFSFRLMVGMGMAMFALSWLGAWLMRKDRLPPRWLLWTFAAFTFSGWVATLAGWMVTEIGRQPWLVSGILKTVQAAGDVPPGELGMSLMVYVLAYGAMFIAYMVVLTHMAGKGAEYAKPLAPTGRGASVAPAGG
jgi:cytochrome d ubiquinol oxidase subunit I